MKSPLKNANQLLQWRRIEDRLNWGFALVCTLFVLVILLYLSRIDETHVSSNPSSLIIQAHIIDAEIDAVTTSVYVQIQDGEIISDVRLNALIKQKETITEKLNTMIQLTNRYKYIDNQITQDLFIHNQNFQETLDRILKTYTTKNQQEAEILLVKQLNPCKEKFQKILGQIIAHESLTLDSEIKQSKTAIFPWLSTDKSITITSLIALMIAAVLIRFIKKQVLPPMHFIEERTKEIALGDFTAKQAPAESPEIQRINFAMNDMANSLHIREEEFTKLAYFDPLTRLSNRSSLLNYFRNRPLEQHSLILLDIARLKTVNETLGFNTGDQIILATSECIVAALDKLQKPAVFLSKFPGGMFAILCPFYEQESITQIISEINLYLSQPMKCDDYFIDVNCVYGIAQTREGPMSITHLIRNAEIALYAAKSKSNTIEWYSPEKEASRVSHLSLLSDLKVALYENQLQMWLQPKLHLPEKKTYGFEALIRWQHPTRGFISPQEFIPFAEKTGYINPITQWMLEQAISTCASWKKRYPKLVDYSIAVNISAFDLRNPNFPDVVTRLLSTYQIEPRYLQLELTESSVMDDPATAIPLLNNLRDIGIGLAIDDFGTGHSSLSYLQKLPVTELKIDKSFVTDIHQHYDAQHLFKAIINMGEALGLSLIAEGVENQAESQEVARLGCKAVQGYYFSKPLYGEALDSWLQKLN